MQRRTRIELDPVTRETVTREMSANEREQYFFGENVGVLVFQPWYPCIAEPGHFANMGTYDFPVRLKFVEEPFDPRGFHLSPDSHRGWNVERWQHCAAELQEEGVRAIVCGCGLTANIQSLLQSAVDIPLYSSTLAFVPELVAQLPQGKRLGIMTVGEEFLRGHGNSAFTECGITDDMPITVAGMYESAYMEDWMTMASDTYESKLLERAVVGVADQMLRDDPDIETIVFECTDMPPFAAAVEATTGCQVFDPVDMVRRVNALAAHEFKDH